MVVTPSRWLASCAASSSLFESNRVEVIPNGIDEVTYRPINKDSARALLGLPRDRLLLLAGGLLPGDQRKGFHLLREALAALRSQDRLKNMEVVVVGASHTAEFLNAAYETHFLGRLQDDLTLAAAYSAVDLFVAPSMQDNLPNTVMEASACGTPSVAFDVGGMPDLIDHQETGYLARPFLTDDLANGIQWVLEDNNRTDRLAQQARQKVLKEFTQQTQAARYAELFGELTKA